MRYVTWGACKAPEAGLVLVPLPRPKGRHFLMTLLYPVVALWIGLYVLLAVRKGDACVFIDFECAVFGVLACRLRNVFSLFDIADPFFLVKPVLRPEWFARAEEWISGQADVTSLPHRLRIELYPHQLERSNTLVIENVPIASSCPASASPERADLPRRVQDGNLVLGYFGQLEARYRGIEDLLALTAQTPWLEFWIAGVGELREQIITLAQTCNRIKFLDGFSQEELPRLTAGIDIYVGLYYSSKHLHRYATPNKYYEHLYLGRPLLTSAETPFAQDVVTHATGWAVEDGCQALAEWGGRSGSGETGADAPELPEPMAGGLLRLLPGGAEQAAALAGGWRPWPGSGLIPSGQWVMPVYSWFWVSNTGGLFARVKP